MHCQRSGCKLVDTYFERHNPQLSECEPCSLIKLGKFSRAKQINHFIHNVVCSCTFVELSWQKFLVGVRYTQYSKQNYCYNLLK